MGPAGLMMKIQIWAGLKSLLKPETLSGGRVVGAHFHTLVLQEGPTTMDGPASSYTCLDLTSSGSGSCSIAPIDASTNITAETGMWSAVGSCCRSPQRDGLWLGTGLGVGLASPSSVLTMSGDPQDTSTHST